MAKTTRKLTTALAVSAALLTARAATAADAPERATIVLHVDDFANLLSSDMDAAEKVARGIFADAGIRTVWVYGREKARPIEGALHVKVLVLSRAMSERKIAADSVGPSVLGQAARACGRAYIFTHRIGALAARNHRHLGQVLGRVIAHEVGHLVLPENSHSPTGIMSAGLNMRAVADPTFSTEQAAAILQTIASGTSGN
jgi:hypothetical protein